MMKKKYTYVLILLLFMLLSSCTRNRALLVFKKEGQKYKVRKYGIASWYGKKFHGRKTSNGEIYNMYTFTAAHKKIPFGTIVKVTNINNGKSVKVRINDRGPYKKGRIIDLSYKAAKEIDMVNDGVVDVKLEIMKK